VPGAWMRVVGRVLSGAELRVGLSALPPLSFRISCSVKVYHGFQFWFGSRWATVLSGYRHCHTSNAACRYAGRRAGCATRLPCVFLSAICGPGPHHARAGPRPAVRDDRPVQLCCRRRVATPKMIVTFRPGRIPVGAACGPTATPRPSSSAKRLRKMLMVGPPLCFPALNTMRTRGVSGVLV